MSEAQILSAFWMPGQKRFCELNGAEVEARSGADLKSPDFQSLRVRRIILATNGSEAQHKMTVYRLAGEGERRVSAMVVMGIPSQAKTPPDSNTTRGCVEKGLTVAATHGISGYQNGRDGYGMVQG